jgi:hypothetical protein
VSEQLILLTEENEFLKLKNKKLMKMSQMRQTFELMQMNSMNLIIVTNN